MFKQFIDSQRECAVQVGEPVVGRQAECRHGDKQMWQEEDREDFPESQGKSPFFRCAVTQGRLNDVPLSVRLSRGYWLMKQSSCE